MIISDASPLICLAQANLIFIIPRLYEKIYIPPAVNEEILSGPNNDPMEFILKKERVEWLDVLPLPYELSPLAKWHLGAGETEVLELARINQGALVLLDDKQARVYARRLNIKMKGTLGVLIEAKRRGIILHLDKAISAIKNSGLWISEEITQKILEEFEESGE